MPACSACAADRAGTLPWLVAEAAAGMQIKDELLELLAAACILIASRQGEISVHMPSEADYQKATGYMVSWDNLPRHLQLSGLRVEQDVHVCRGTSTMCRLGPAQGLGTSSSSAAHSMLFCMSDCACQGMGGQVAACIPA